MAALPRVLQKIFAANAAADEIGEFGSLAAGTPTTTTDPDAMQAANWLGGWFAGVVGNNSPAIEDWNAVCYVFAYQLAYIFEKGVPEWNDETTYYLGSMVLDLTTGALYISKQNTNLNHALSDTAWWVKVVPTITVLSGGASGTFTVNSFVKALRVRGVAGGGGGGGCDSTAGQCAGGSGGGGGGYFEKVIISPSATYTYSVGTGGAGGATGASAGSSGLATTFGTLVANGGGAGTGGGSTAGPAFSSIGGATGGTASNGDFNIAGTNGGASIVLNPNEISVGLGGASHMAPSQNPISSNGSHVGASGKVYGGGGNGGSQQNGGGAQAGGPGAPGLLIIEELF